MTQYLLSEKEYAEYQKIKTRVEYLEEYLSTHKHSDEEFELERKTTIEIASVCKKLLRGLDKLKDLIFSDDEALDILGSENVLAIVNEAKYSTNE